MRKMLTFLVLCSLLLLAVGCDQPQDPLPVGDAINQGIQPDDNAEERDTEKEEEEPEEAPQQKAAFTPTESTYKATITIDGNQNLGTINPLIYGTNSWIENSKLGIPAHPNTDKTTFYETQVAKFYNYFETYKDMRPTIIRIPGGLQANHDDWKDMIGPYEDRPERVASGIKQIAVFGLDEHVEVAKDMGASIIWTVNAFGSSPEDAAALAEYLKPHGVKYYEIGNELNCNMKNINPLNKPLVLEYARKVVDLSQAMKAVDPSIKIGALDDCDKIGKDWYDLVTPIMGDHFDFWIKHAYSPGADGAVRGFTITKPNFELTTKHDFQESGIYTFEFLAEGKKNWVGTPSFELFIDGESAGRITLTAFNGNHPKAHFYSLTKNVEQGEHEITIKSGANTDGNVYFRMHPIISAQEGDNEEEIIDLRHDPVLSGLVTAGSFAVGARVDEEKEWFDGKPLFVTEWNTVYNFDECSPRDGILKDHPNRCASNLQVREVLNTAHYYQLFAEAGDLVEGANFWLLFTDLGNTNVNKEEETLTINPSYHVAKSFSLLMQGNRLQTDVDTPTYDVGYSTGITLGKVSKTFDIPYVSAFTAQNDAQVNVVVINRNIEEDVDLTLDLSNLEVASQVRHLYLHSTERYGNAWATGDETFSVSGNSLQIRIPRESVNILMFTT